jgi:hypothetical protein
MSSLLTMCRMFAFSALVCAGALVQGCGGSDEAATDQEIENAENKLDEALNKRGNECCAHGVGMMSFACMTPKTKKAVSTVLECANAVASMPCSDLAGGNKSYPNPCPEVCEPEVTCAEK